MWSKYDVKTKMILPFSKQLSSAFYKSQLKRKAQKGQPAEKLFLELISKNIKNTIIYGAGEVCSSFLNLCAECEYQLNIEYIIDKRAEKELFEVSEMRVYPPSFLINKKPNNIVIASACYVGEMIETIESFTDISNSDVITVLNSKF